MPFAGSVGRLRCMTQRKRDTKAILRTVERSELRSPLFRWMVEHHDELVEASRRDGIHWASFCAEAAKRGLTDTQGRPPTTDNARKTWERVRRVVQKARAEAAAKPPKPIYPSRTPKGWMPPGIAAAIAAGNPAVEEARPSSISGGNGPAASPERGFAVRSSVPPPPIPTAKPAPDEPLSRYARPDDSPEVKAAFASIEAQLDKADWYLMAGKPRKRRTE